MPGFSTMLHKFRKNGKEEVEMKRDYGKTYLKAMPLHDLSELGTVKSEVESGNIMILRITPLAKKSIDDIKKAVNELCEFVEAIGGDIARLGEERVVICPPNVQIWREKKPLKKEPIPTAAYRSP